MRTCRLLEDQAWVLGLQGRGVVTALAALMCRQLLGAEKDIVACFERVWARCCRWRGAELAAAPPQW